MTEYHIEHTNEYVDVPGSVSKIPKFDTNTKAHLWVIASMHETNIETLVSEAQSILDHENLIYMSPVACFHCEVTWYPDIVPICPGPVENFLRRSKRNG